MHAIPDIRQLTDVVRRCAQQQLIPRFTCVSREYKQDGSVVTEADLAMQSHLTEELAALWPEVRLLGEEMTLEQQTQLLEDTERPLWCLDPVDGTSNFASGIPYFAVSIGLIHRGEVKLALVYDPMRDEAFTALPNQGAWLNGARLQPDGSCTRLDKAIALVDFKRLTPELRTRLAAEAPYSSQRNFGSSALDWCWLACGRGQLYLHGKQNLWDYCAAQLILAEAGGKATTLEGEPVFQARMAPRSVVAAQDAALFQQWQAWVAGD